MKTQVLQKMNKQKLESINGMLNEGVEPCLELTVYDVQMDLIDWEGQSVRDALDDDHVVELSMSILSRRLLNPITIKRKENGRFQGCAGFHRYAAYTRLKRTTIPANIRANDDTPVKALALIENIVRKDMSLKEEVEAVSFLSEEENLSTSQICDLLGKSRDWVDKRLTIPGLPADVREELMDGRISIKHAEILGGIEDAGARKSVTFSAIQNRLTARDTAELAKLYMEPYSVADAVESGLEKIAEQRTATPTLRACEACGKLRPLGEIKYVPICMYGCDQGEKEKINEAEPGNSI